jgi:hypothetical protein
MTILEGRLEVHTCIIDWMKWPNHTPKEEEEQVGVLAETP